MKFKTVPIKVLIAIISVAIGLDKASQVWLTGVKTGEYERWFSKASSGKCQQHRSSGFDWMGGQPLTMKNGTILSAGFSGFRGCTDIEIMVKALAVAEQD